MCQSCVHPTSQYVRWEQALTLHRRAILKKTSVSGVAAGCFIKVRMGTFFFIFAKKIFFFKNGQYFPTKKKIMGKKKKMRPPYWLQKRTPAGPETEVFLGWPRSQLFKAEVQRLVCRYRLEGRECPDPLTDHALLYRVGPGGPGTYTAQLGEWLDWGKAGWESLYYFWFC